LHIWRADLNVYESVDPQSLTKEQRRKGALRKIDLIKEKKMDNLRGSRSRQTTTAHVV